MSDDVQAVMLIATAVIALMIGVVNITRIISDNNKIVMLECLKSASPETKCYKLTYGRSP